MISFWLTSRLLRIAPESLAAPLAWRTRLVAVMVALVLPFVLFKSVLSTGKERFASDALNELAGNGLYADEDHPEGLQMPHALARGK